MQKIFLNNQEIDLYDNVDIERVIELNNLGDISSKQSSYSNNISIPKTAKNISVLQGLSLQGSRTRVQYDYLRCDYYFNEIPIFQNGLAVVTESNRDTYDLTLFNGIIEFSTLVENLNLEDLDFSELFHTFNIEYYRQHTAITPELPPILYSIEHEFVEETNTNLRVRGELNGVKLLNEMFPVVSTKWLFRNIFEQQGYTIEGDIFTDRKLFDRFDVEYTTLSEGYIIEQEVFDDVISSRVSNTFNYNLDVRQDRFFPDSRDFSRFNRTIDLSTQTTSDFRVRNGQLTVLEATGEVEINVSSISRISPSAGGAVLYLNNVTTGESTRLFSNSNNTQPLRIITQEPNTVFEIEVRPTSELSDDSQFEVVNVNLDYDIEFVKIQDNGFDVRQRHFKFGELSQIDFIQDVLNRYGLLLNKTPNKNEFIVRNVNNLIDRQQANIIDWTNKFVSQGSETYSNTYGQLNKATFQYQFDEDTPAEGRKDGSFKLNQPLSDAENNLFESVFSMPPAEIISTISGNSFRQTQYLPLISVNYELEEGSETNIINTTYTNLEADITLFEAYRFTKDPDPSGFNPNTALVGFPNDIPVKITEHFYLLLEVDELQEHLDDYYSDYLNVLENYKVLEFEFRLDTSDILNFDFYSLIYLQQTGQHYYINRLTYNVNSPIVSAELVQLP